jgi:hypothetical protein
MEEHGMNRRIKSAWLLASLVAVLVVQASPAAAKASYIYGFEKGPEGWAAGSTGSPSDTFFTILKTENGCPSLYDTSHAFVKFNAEAGKPSGAWLVNSFPTTSNGADIVRVNFCAKSQNICPDCKIALYAGSELPTNLDKFQTVSPSITDRPTVGDWISYQYPSPGAPDVPVYNKGKIYVAIGVTSPSAKVLTSEAFGLDCIELTIFPAP